MALTEDRDRDGSRVVSARPTRGACIALIDNSTVARSMSANSQSDAASYGDTAKLTVPVPRKQLASMSAIRFRITTKLHPLHVTPYIASYMQLLYCTVPSSLTKRQEPFGFGLPFVPLSVARSGAHVRRPRRRCYFICDDGHWRRGCRLQPLSRPSFIRLPL